MGKSLIKDAATGFATLALVMLGLGTGLVPQDVRVLVIVSAVLYLAAAVLRGAAPPLRPLVKAVSINCGSAVPVVAMSQVGFAFTDRTYLSIFLITSFIATLAGVYVRRLWRVGRPSASATLGIAWVSVAVLVGYLGMPVLVERLFSEPVSRVAPPFAFTSLQGHPIDNQSLRGRVVVLAFWATWCAPCREELPRLDRVYARFKNDRDVVFLAVNNERDDDASRAAVKATSYFAKARLGLPLVLTDDQTANRLGVSGLPTLIVIDQGGNIRFVHTGYDGAESLERVVGEQLRRLLHRS